SICFPNVISKASPTLTGQRRQKCALAPGLDRNIQQEYGKAQQAMRRVTGKLVGSELKDERKVSQRPCRQLLFVAGQKSGQVASGRSRGREALAIDTFHAELAQSRSESPGETRSVRDGRKVAEFTPTLVNRARGQRLNAKPADRGEAGAGQA